MLDPGRGKTKTGFMWAIARDDRPWGGTDPPAVAYTYAPGRGGVHAVKLLDGFSGVLQVDGYAVYNQLARPTRAGGPVTLAFCWSHLRRKFYELYVGGSQPIATRGAGAHQAALRHRGRDPRAAAAGAARHAPGEGEAGRRRC